MVFLSTLSLRRATVRHSLAMVTKIFLSTLSLRRATREKGNPFREVAISIHALLAESDGLVSARHRGQIISIHALLAESDLAGAPGIWQHGYFYPRSPCGERPHPIGVLITVIKISIHALLAESDQRETKANEDRYKFLSTLSLRRATSSSKINSSFIIYFYPRSPCGERPVMNNIVLMPGEFLSTLSLRRAT